jgi:predicted anti-sigma-YlaC factor YlaD
MTYSKITCKKAVDLISKKEEGKLSAFQRFQLWRHLAECSLCRKFSAQNKLIAKAFGLRQPVDKLTEKQKAEIIEKVLGSKPGQ